MSRDFDGTNDELSINSDDSRYRITGAQSAIAWEQWDGAGTAAHVFGRWGSSNANRTWRLLIGSTNTGGFQSISAAVAAFSANGTTAINGATTTWHALSGSFRPSTNIEFYLDGASETTTTASAPATLNDPAGIHTQIGEDHADANDFDGRIGHCAYWGADLTDDEHHGLGKGVNPLWVRAASLVGYWPVWGLQSPDPDWSGGGSKLGGVAMTVVAGTSRSANNPPVSMPPFAC